MPNSAIEQITNAEIQAQNAIETARKEVEDTIAKTEAEFEKKHAEAETLTGSEIAKILNEAQITMQGMKKMHETEITNSLNGIKSTSEEKIKIAADAIVKNVLK